MRALLRLHWRLFANHIGRRIGYLRVYLNGGGLITYLWVAAFVLFYISWYFYAPYTRIPPAVRQNIVLAGLAILGAGPAFWLLGGLVRVKTPILMSAADVQFLPLLPVRKQQVLWEEWLWPFGRRVLLSLVVPALVFPFVHLFWPGYPLKSVFFVQWLWAVCGALGLCLQWLGAAFWHWLDGKKIWYWIKTALSALFLIFILFQALSFPGAHPAGGTANPLASGYPGFTVPALSDAHIFFTAALLTLLTAAVVWGVLKWYGNRPWEPILSQSEKVYTLRTLVRARDMKALRRLRRRTPGRRISGRLFARLYFSPDWALAWKSMLAWRGMPLFQTAVSLLAPLLLVRLLGGGLAPAFAANPLGQFLAISFILVFPVTLFTLNGYNGLLSAWQEDLQQMEKFRLLPLYPRGMIVASMVPAGLLAGLAWGIGGLLVLPYSGLALLLGGLLAFLEGILGALLVGREMLKDPSSATSAFGPERLVSGVVWLAGPLVSQGSHLTGAGLTGSLLAGCGVAASAAFGWLVLMENDWMFLRSQYE